MKTRIFSTLIFFLVTVYAFSSAPESSLRISLPDQNAFSLVREAFAKISDNYPCDNYLIDGFYRESIIRDGYAISINEAILGIGKTSYNNYISDKVEVKNARSTTPLLTSGDSVILTLQAGPYSALMTDIVKKSLPGAGRNSELLNDKYMFWYGDPEYINGTSFVTVIFDQRYPGEELLCRGKIFIEPQSKAIGRIEFCMNVEKRADSYKLFIKKNPASMDIIFNTAKYIVNYRENMGKWFLSTSESEIDFTVNRINKSDRKKYSSSTDYSVKSQLAAASYTAGNFKADKRDILKENQQLSEFIGKSSKPARWDILNVTLDRLFAQKSLSPKPDVHIN